MDDLAALRELRSGAPTADSGQLTQGRWKLMAAAAEEEAGQVRARRTWLPRSRVRRTALVAVTAAAVTAGVLTLQPGTTGGSPGSAVSAAPPGASGGSTAELPSVATVLAAAAVNAEKSPVGRPTADQWVFHDEVACDAGCSINPQWVKGDGSQWVVPRSVPVPGKKPVLDQRPVGRHLGALDDIRFEPIAMYDAFAQLPTDPAALLKEVSTDPRFVLYTQVPDEPRPPVLPTANSTHFPGAKPYTIKVRDPKTHKLVNKTLWYRPGPGAIGEPAKPEPLSSASQYRNILALMQNTPVIPAKVNAALFKALALIPGTQLVETPMKDAFGRPSTTISATSVSSSWRRNPKSPQGWEKVVTRFTTYLFLNPRTYAYQGYRTLIDDGSSVVPEEQTRKATQVVDKPGTVEGGADWVGYKLPKWDGIPAPR